MVKAIVKNSTQAKPPKSSSMTHEDIEDLGNWVSNFQIQIDGVKDDCIHEKRKWNNDYKPPWIKSLGKMTSRIGV